MGVLEGVASKIKSAFRLGVNAYWEYKPLFNHRRFVTSLDEIKIDRPIFLLGVEGCGLTLLTRMIHRHNDVVTVGGGRNFWVGNNEIDKQCIWDLPDDFELRSPRLQSPVFKRHMRGDEFEHPIFGTERSWVYACDDMVDRYRRKSEDWSVEKERSIRKVIKESIRAYTAPPHQARFVDMSQTFTLKVPLLRKIFSNPRFVVQTRNPYASCLKEAMDMSYQWRRHNSMETKIRLFAEHWRNSYKSALMDLEDMEQSIFIRYEDLVSNTIYTLREVLDTIELSFHQDMTPKNDHRLPLGATERHKWFPVRANENRKYLDKITPQYSRIIDDVIGDLVEDLGYGKGCL